MEMGTDTHRRSGGDDHATSQLTVLPIAIISVLAVFGFPAAIVAVIMFSSWARTRSLHRTVRMMVEKGQPVPPELLSSPAAASAGNDCARGYDLRRGIVLSSRSASVIDHVFRNQCRLGQRRLGARFDPRLDRSGLSAGVATCLS